MSDEVLELLTELQPVLRDSLSLPINARLKLKMQELSSLVEQARQDRTDEKSKPYSEDF